MLPKIEIVHDEKLNLGERSHWDHETKLLYYVDILESIVFKFDPIAKKVTRVIVGSKIAVLTWDGVSAEPSNLEIIVEVDHGTDHRFNDGKTDPRGRLWSGTMAKYNPDIAIQRCGTLYSLSNDGKTAEAHFGNVGISNGLALSTDLETMYYINSYNRAVWGFDYDINNGDISNQQVIFDFKKNNIVGLPDGMTTDKEDKLWIAVFGAGGVYQIDPKSDALLKSIEFPIPIITSCVWGGVNLDELYVTSLSTWDSEGHPKGGCLFRVTGLGTSRFPGAAARF